MILDEDRRFLYIKDKVIDLTKLETKMLCFFIKNKGKMMGLSELAKFCYKNYDIKMNKNMQTSIHRLNLKLKPYAKIVCKSKIGYILKIFC